MRTAIVHYWLMNRRGGEKVLEALCGLLPDADIFTLFCDPAAIGPALRGRRIVASSLNPLRRHYRSLLPLMPMALESFDLREYDLVVSSESGPAKGVLTPSHTRHICYCHTPMRYLWDLYPAYRNEWTQSRWKRAAMAPLAHYLRLWDYATAARVDRFIANSRNVQDRIWRTYRRESDVIYPPVDVDSFYWKPPEDYYLVVSELVPYKRIDLAVRHFSRTGQRLCIAGMGPELTRLKQASARNVEFLGHVPDQALRELYARCRAFLIPGEEDFGMTAVEALASGKAVIALGRGGAPEIVRASCGVFFDAPTGESLAQAIQTFEIHEDEFDPVMLQTRARQFRPEVFSRKMASVLAQAREPVPSF